jgi:hypothetical protein
LFLKYYASRFPFGRFPLLVSFLKTNIYKPSNGSISVLFFEINYYGLQNYRGRQYHDKVLKLLESPINTSASYSEQAKAEIRIKSSGINIMLKIHNLAVVTEVFLNTLSLV